MQAFDVIESNALPDEREDPQT